MGEVKKEELIYPELSYKLVGAAFDVFNELGYGHREVIYENAFEEKLKELNLKYERQLYVPLQFKNKKIGKYYLDFIVDNKVVIELKQGKRFSKKVFEQVNSYLKSNNKKLGIVIHFLPDGVKFKRIVNLY